MVGALIARGLVQEAEAGHEVPVWREANGGRRVTLLATDAALAVLGIEADSAPTGADEAPQDPTPKARGRRNKAAPVARTTPAPRKARDGSKQAQLIAMLERPEGATLAQIVAATGWQPHTVRGAIAGALKKKLGLTVTSDKVEGAERTYRVIR